MAAKQPVEVMVPGRATDGGAAASRVNSAADDGHGNQREVEVAAAAVYATDAGQPPVTESERADCRTYIMRVGGIERAEFVLMQEKAAASQI